MEKDVVIIGAGPAGLSAAIEASKSGASVLVADMNLKAGGQLFKQIHKFFGSSEHYSGTRGIDIGKLLLDEAEKEGVDIWLRSTVVGISSNKTVVIERTDNNEEKSIVTVKAKSVIIATGASENVIRFKGWTSPGVMGAGAAQTMINVNHVRPGNKVVVLGSGNVGLIVSYQLMQAGCKVQAIVEASSKIGGYLVHAAKIRRAGVPIYIKNTITEAILDESGCVKGVLISEVNKNFEPISGTEKYIEADCVAIAAGLKPSTELARLMECKFTFNGVFGGYIPLHNEKMETSKSGIYVAGDVSGVEEASTAMEEGRIAGISAAEALGLISSSEGESKRKVLWERVNLLRMGSFGDIRKRAKDSVLNEYMEGVREVC